ncbi:glutamate receptor ionotropic, NMDA 2B-like [Ylistrum balloti]|uniref:glutamate receptor ionotropic, NMDA 2B-like n=1 Tax=Ylistrum balloti TaxID=509963 RepID=UPI002905F622|nr:glutamate receptor ionotropic, NMDA 2B-like [Ylistrum balloti]
MRFRDHCNFGMLDRIGGKSVRSTYLVLFTVLPVCYSFNSVTFYAIMPHMRTLEKTIRTKMLTTKYFLERRSVDHSVLTRKFHIDFHFKMLPNYSPGEILDTFCESVFPKHTNALLYLKSNRGNIVKSSRDVIVDIAKSIGYPVISWDPEFPGALQQDEDSMVLQLAPTIYHQCQCMLALLQRYNWTDFAIVTTTTEQHLEFVNSVNTLVKLHNSKQGITRVTRMTILSTIIVDMDSNDDDEKQRELMKKEIKRKNTKENRVFLLHTGSLQAKNLLDAAEELELTGEKYIWILTSFSVGQVKKGHRTSFSYPIGSIGINYYKDRGENEAEAAATSLMIWAKALKNIAEHLDKFDMSPKMSCNVTGNDTWRDGRALYTRMKAVHQLYNDTVVRFSSNGVNELVKLKLLNVQHQTGYQAWKEVGQWIPYTTYRRSEMRIQMKEIVWPGGKNKPPKGKPEKRHFKIVTLKEDPYVMYRDPDKVTGKCGHHSVPCRLVYNPAEHENDSTLLNNTVLRCCTGLCIDLLKILSERMDFDYELYEVPDQTWGLPDQRTGQWNGLIKQVMTHRADMIMTSLKITPKRNEFIDFSVPFLETGISIVVSIRKGAISPTAFLEPYDYPSWCLILVFSVHATGASIFIYEWLSPRGLDQGRTSLREHRFSLFRSLWLIWAMLFGASVSTDTPRGVSSRFLANVWALFALVFLASYTANLAAFMITKDEYYNLSGIKDVRLKQPYSHSPPFRFATVPNGSTEENLRQNHQQMFAYMRQFNQSTVDGALKSLKDGKIHAFIYDATPLEYHVGNDKDCELTTVGDWYAMTGYGVGFPRGSTWVEEVDQIILKLQKSGEMERLRKFWLAGACHRRKQKRGHSSHNIGILNFTSAFIFLAGGMLVGVVLLIAEHLYFKFGRKCLRKYDKNGCCALVSLSMGQSLTFEQSVIEAIDMHKRHRCKDPLCETQLWKVRHELDLSKFTIEKLKDQLQSFGIKPLEGNLFRHKKKQALEQNPNPKPNGYPRCNRSEGNEEEHRVCTESQSKERLLQDSECTSTSPYMDDPSLTRWSKRSLRRSPSYTNAIAIDPPGDSSGVIQRHINKVRCHDGKYYVGVSNDNPTEGYDMTHYVE